VCWDASTDATVTGYRVYGKTEEQVVFSPLGEVEDTVLCFNTGHPIYVEGINILWSYFVVAINASNEESPISRVISNDLQTVATFSVDTSTGETPLKVQFTDESLGSPTAWKWDFDNDGITDSTQQSPIFTYKEPGTYTVELEASGPYGEDSTTKLNFVEVKKRKPICIPFRASDGGKMPICF
jgi:PKD repeat protein